MSLLREIQACAIDGTSDLETLLRRCRVLATRLQHDEFKQWVLCELDGYPEEIGIPEYRRIRCQAYGHFFGPFDRELGNAQIPSSCIPKQLRERLTTLSMRQSVSSLTVLANDAESGIINMNWPADVYPLFEGKVYQGMSLAQAWLALPKSSVFAILSTVRNRILNFSLEIESANPAAGEATPDTKPIPTEQVSQIFNTYIYGNVGSMASGYDVSQVTQQNISKGDFESLAHYLGKMGLSKGEISELKEALTEEAKTMSAEAFGPRVAGWIGKAVSKIAQGGMKLSTSVASDVLSTAIKAYFGL